VAPDAGATDAGAPDAGATDAAPVAPDAGATEATTGRVDEALCQAACAHALEVTEAELPAEVSPEVRATMRAAMHDECPRSCMEKGTLASVQCVIRASTVLQISACSE
jgi:hypothetical protein